MMWIVKKGTQNVCYNKYKNMLKIKENIWAGKVVLNQ